MMYTYAPFTSIRDYRHSLYATGAKARWFNSKRITEPRKRHHRDFRNAVAVCAKKRRYGLLAGVLAVSLCYLRDLAHVATEQAGE